MGKDLNSVTKTALTGQSCSIPVNVNVITIAFNLIKYEYAGKVCRGLTFVLMQISIYRAP